MDVIAKRKQELLVSSEEHKKAISDDFRSLSTKAENLATDGLVIAGVWLSAAAIFKLLKGKSTKKSPKKSNRLLDIIKQQIWIFILNEGRKRIVEYINGLDEKET